MILLCSDSITERHERTGRLKRDRLLRYSRALFLTFIIFFREFDAPFLFPFHFLVSLRFHVLFMIQSFLFLAFGHFLTLQSIRLQSTLKDIAILRHRRTKRHKRDRIMVCRSARYLNLLHVGVCFIATNRPLVLVHSFSPRNLISLYPARSKPLT